MAILNSSALLVYNLLLELDSKSITLFKFSNAIEASSRVEFPLA